MQHLHPLKNYHLETKQFKKKLITAAFLIAFLLILLILRLLNLQVLNHETYLNLSTNNQLAYLPIEPNRGLIYDRNGILLAENVPTFSLNILAKHVKELDEILKRLDPIIKVNQEDIKQFKKSLRNRHRFEHIPIKLKLTKEEAASFYVKQYFFPELLIDNKMIRNYPLSNKTVNAVGYVGRINKQDFKNIDSNNYDASDFIGKVGIEKYYEKSLHGKTGYKIAEVNASGQIVRDFKTIPPIPGKNLHLTIDSKLQQMALEALEEENGAIVAIDPNNGEILAMVSKPNYNPNLFVTGINSDTFDKLQSSKDKPMYNRATKSLFPPASTIKPFIALQALENEVATSDYQISDPGWFKLPNTKHIYRDWKYNGHGIVDITKAITVSCDTFFYTIGVALGIQKISEILEKFGFGKKTGIDIPEESSGIIASPEWKMKHVGNPWYTGDTVISSIGQGYMSATPLQLAHAVSTIAIRGQRFKPHLLLTTQSPDRKTQAFNKPATLPKVTLKNPKNWDIVINAMKEVITNPSGTAYSRFGKNTQYSVAGKTGGAQLYHHKVVNEDPTYREEKKIPKHLRNHNLFIAFAPVENPKIALAVITENSTLAPKVARKILDYYLTR